MQAFRGIRLITAVTIAAELADLKRFGSARQLMAFLGLVPSEHSSGQSQQRGRITRTGNSHVRRVLVEAAWSYRYQPRMSKAIRLRNEGLAPGVQRLAWEAQKRLHNRLNHLAKKGYPSTNNVKPEFTKLELDWSNRNSGGGRSGAVSGAPFFIARVLP